MPTTSMFFSLLVLQIGRERATEVVRLGRERQNETEVGKSAIMGQEENGTIKKKTRGVT